MPRPPALLGPALAGGLVAGTAVAAALSLGLPAAAAAAGRPGPVPQATPAAPAPAAAQPPAAALPPTPTRPAPAAALPPTATRPAPVAPHALPTDPARHPGAEAAPAAPGTGWPALDAAVLRIPGYAATTPVRWSVAASGPWGSTLWPADTVTVNRHTPLGRLDDVVRHEWAHVLQDRVWAGDTGQLLAELDAAFGGAGTTGAERAADCMARGLGATWTYYTSCADPSWRTAAGRLLAGQRPAT